MNDSKIDYYVKGLDFDKQLKIYSGIRDINRGVGKFLLEKEQGYPSWRHAGDSNSNIEKKLNDSKKEFVHLNNIMAENKRDMLFPNPNDTYESAMICVDLMKKRSADELYQFFGCTYEEYEVTECENEVHLLRELYIEYKKMGKDSESKGDYNAAKEFFEKALEFCLELVEKDGSSENRLELSVIYDYLGNVLINLNNLSKAKEYYELGLKNDETSYQKNPNDDTMRCLAIGYERMGKIYDEMGENTLSLDYYEKALVVFEQLEKKQRTVDSRKSLAIEYYNAGRISVKKRLLSKAKDYYKKRLQVREKILIETFSEEARLEYALAYDSLAEVCIDLGELSMANDYYVQEAKIYEMLLKTNNDIKTRRWLTFTYVDLGFLERRMHNNEKERAYFEKAYDICKAVFEETNSEQAKDDFAFACCYVAESVSEKSHLYKRAYELWDELATRFPNNPDYAKRRDMAKKYI